LHFSEFQTRGIHTEAYCLYSVLWTIGLPVANRQYTQRSFQSDCDVPATQSSSG